MIINHNSKRCDDILDNWRLNYLLRDSDGHIEQGSHKIQEIGYGYFLQNLKDLPSGKKRKGMMVEVTGSFPFTLSEHNSIGKVTKIFALKSSSNTITDVNLQKLAFQRLQS